jgi:hypothetical protein
VRRRRVVAAPRDELARHPEVNQERVGFGGAVRLQPQLKELAVTQHVADAPPRELPFERGGVVHKIRFAELHAENAATGQRGAQAADDGFDLGQLRHGHQATTSAAGGRYNHAPTRDRFPARLRASLRAPPKTASSAGLPASNGHAVVRLLRC